MPQHPSMYCQVYIENVNVTDYVISYRREHKLCTGIGMLTLELSYHLHDQIKTWDHIRIFENAGKEGSYFVNQIDDSKPNATITVTAQDNSKRMTDYFIDKTYIIDYPSYTRTWIQKFLSEAGITYEFKVPDYDYGSLLSNNTQLGMMSCYEQIIQLLQISNWYIYFTPSNKAIIGKLNEPLKGGTLFNKDNVTDIKVVTHDKLLRNRVVVWGKKHPIVGWVTGEAKKITKWNYDKKDYRSLVISNSNIPTYWAAADLANKALAEFTKPNQEIHITAYGAYGSNVGNFATVRVPHIWQGKGLVTTYGTMLSAQGFQTFVILNERCPRLFAFYDFGDYVYISTATSGVWRKLINGYEWENFSSGLLEQSIVDIHLSAGAMGAVSKSGNPYASIVDFSGWSPVTLSGITYEGVTSSGTIGEITVASGLKTRATIVDRMSNYVKFSIDNAPWDNDLYYQPYPSGLMEQIFASGGNGIMLTNSGFNMDNARSWIVEYDTFSGQIVTVTPVVALVSGTILDEAVFARSSSVIVFDIENDGVTDYLSAMVKGPGLYSFVSAPNMFTYDISNKLTLSGFTIVGDKYPFNMGENFVGGAILHSGIQFVWNAKQNTISKPVNLGGLPQQRMNGIHPWVYRRPMDRTLTYIADGPWGLHFFTVNGNPTIVYLDTNGLNFVEMVGYNTTSGFMLSPEVTLIERVAFSGAMPNTALGIVQMSDNQYDVVFPYQVYNPTISRGANVGVKFVSYDKSTKKQIAEEQKVGTLMREYPWPSNNLSYYNNKTSQQNSITMLRVKDFIYFLNYVETPIEGTSDPVYYNYDLVCEVLDLKAKTIKSKVYFRNQTEDSPDNPVLGPASLYQIGDSVGICAVLGRNNNQWQHFGEPSKWNPTGGKFATVEYWHGAAKYGELPTLVMAGTVGPQYPDIDRQQYVDVQSRWMTNIGFTFNNLYVQRFNPNAVNTMYQDRLDLWVRDPITKAMVLTSIMERYMGITDNQFYWEVYEYDPSTYPDNVTNQAAKLTRPQIVGNPNQYYGYGYMGREGTYGEVTEGTLLAGYLESATRTYMHTFDELPKDWERLCIFNMQDTLSSGVYALMRSDRWEYELWESRPDGTMITGIPFYGMPSGWRTSKDDTTYTFGVSAMNFFVVFPYKQSTTFDSDMVFNFYYSPALMSGYTYATLEKTLSGFKVLDYYDKQPRIDVSKYSPVLVATDSVSSIRNIYGSVTDTTVTEPQYIISSGTYEKLADFRYADFAISGVPSGVILEDDYSQTYSGMLATERRVVFATPSGLLHAPIDDINTTTLWFGSPGITQIETTNNAYDYQYFFVSVSGEDGIYNFYQKDNTYSGLFYECFSGLPQSYVTRIRVDDLV